MISYIIASPPVLSFLYLIPQHPSPEREGGKNHKIRIICPSPQGEGWG
jgi:hypothetical protein